MNIEILIKALSIEEKKVLFKLLSEELMCNPKTEGYTTVEEFCMLKGSKMSTRLRNVLLANSDRIGRYIESMDSESVKRCRDAGNKTRLEFIELRGY